MLSRRALLPITGFLFAALVAGSAAAKPSFEARFKALQAKQAKVLVKMKASDDPDQLPDTVGSGPVVIAHKRSGFYTPPLLSPEDMSSVVQENLRDLRRCYKKQLAADPEWADSMILDIAVRRSGHVSEVSISPRRVRRAKIGACLLSAVPRWRFPEFTGETGEGITQEVVNASFPLSFSAD